MSIFIVLVTFGGFLAYDVLKGHQTEWQKAPINRAGQNIIDSGNLASRARHPEFSRMLGIYC